MCICLSYLVRLGLGAPKIAESSENPRSQRISRHLARTPPKFLEVIEIPILSLYKVNKIYKIVISPHAVSIMPRNSLYFLSFAWSSMRLVQFALLPLFYLTTQRFVTSSNWYRPCCCWQVESGTSSHTYKASTWSSFINSFYLFEHGFSFETATLSVWYHHFNSCRK